MVRRENILQGEKIRLTALADADLETISRWYEDSYFLRLYDSAPAYPKTRKEIQERIKESQTDDGMTCTCTAFCATSGQKAEGQLCTKSMPSARRGRVPFRIVGLLLGLLGALLFSACNGQQPSVTRLVEVTRLVTATPAANTEATTVTRLVVVTATPAPTSRRTFATDAPDHFRVFVDSGPQTLDPALAIDPASRHLVQNVVESLLLPNPQEPETLLPLLATRWLNSEDGLTYTFVIRPGVTFSNGSMLTAEDVAYSLQRALLQSTPDSPFGSLLEPLLGYDSGDVTEEIENGAYAGDRDALLNNASTRELIAVCEQVKEAIVADDSVGTVTFSLVKRWAPFPAALSRPWTGIIDREWAVEQGAWDGGCETWAEWYAPGPTDSILATTIMGTGPYILDHWTPGAEYVLVSNDDYWRRPSMPMMGADGPGGSPAIKRVTVRQEPEAHLRWQALRDGDAESADLSPEAQLLAQQLVGEICHWPSRQCQVGENEEGPLRLYTELIMPSRHALFFNFNINSEGNNFIGSGQLDGNGIPANFFSDVRVRRALAYCFDETRFVELALNGNGRLASTLLPGHYGGEDVLSATYGFQQQACAEELAAAWDNLLPATGFHLQIPFESGNDAQQKAALLLQEGLRTVSGNYDVEIVGLARPEYLQELREGRLPLALLSWTSLLPDPHSWVAPAFSSEVLAFQHLPPDVRNRFVTLLEDATFTLEEEIRRALYQSLDTQRHELVPHILLPEPTGSHYQQRWVQNWFYHPTFAEPYYYAYTLNDS